MLAELRLQEMASVMKSAIYARVRSNTWTDNRSRVRVQSKLNVTREDSRRLSQRTEQPTPTNSN